MLGDSDITIDQRQADGFVQLPSDSAERGIAEG